MIGFIEKEFELSCEVLNAARTQKEMLAELGAVIEVCIGSLKQGGTIYFAGNGGSAADAQHFAAELVSRFYYDRPGLASEALTTDTSILTAVGNDYGYEHVFSRQIEAKTRKGDVFFGITTSGSSANIIRALQVGRDRGVITVGMTGENGQEMRKYCDHLLVAPSASTPKIQEVHGVLGHILCAAIERELFPAR